MTAKSVALFGSSFNPPHLGHWAVLRDLVRKNVFDEIWLVPVWKHAFDKELAAFETRTEMLRLLMEELGDTPVPVRVCTVEKDLNAERSYTFDTVTELKKRHPGVEFALIVGSDVKNELSKWHRAEELKKIVSFHFVPRRGYADSPYPEVSSSEIREKIKRGEDVSSLTTGKIAESIKRNRLYADD